MPRKPATNTSAAAAGGPATAAQEQQRARIAAELAALAAAGFALPGSVAIRRYQCGKPTCHCHADPAAAHGPYIHWTRKVRAKTVSRTLTDEQRHDYQDWFARSRRLRELLKELEQLSLQIVESDQRWPQPRT